jgi:hypothetical protein
MLLSFFHTTCSYYCILLHILYIASFQRFPVLLLLLLLLCEDNIRMDLMKIGWEVVDWINLAQDRDQCRPLMNLWVP